MPQERVNPSKAAASACTPIALVGAGAAFPLATLRDAIGIGGAGVDRRDSEGTSGKQDSQGTKNESLHERLLSVCRSDVRS